MARLTRAIYRLRFTWNCKDLQVVKTTLKRSRKRRTHLPDFKTSSKAVAVKIIQRLPCAWTPRTLLSLPCRCPGGIFPGHPLVAHWLEPCSWAHSLTLSHCSQTPTPGPWHCGVWWGWTPQCSLGPWPLALSPGHIETDLPQVMQLRGHLLARFRKQRQVCGPTLSPRPGSL